MTQPVIVGFRLVKDRPDNGAVTLAKLAIEHGPWVMTGLRLCRNNADGSLFIKGPILRPGDRIAMRSGPDRDALISQASALLGELGAIRTAASPLATAPQLEPSK